MTGWTRRAVLATSTAAGLLAGKVRAGTITATPAKGMTMTPGANRIDVHQHLLPPEFLAALDRHGMSAWAPAKWSAEGALAMMDEHQIATGILSLSTPGPHLGNDAEARVLARQVNERQAALVQAHPDRFGMFACVPLPDIDGALQAIAYAYDHLSTDGVILLANNAGVYVGDPAFDPVMEELNRRSAVVFIHPGPIAGPPAKGIHPSLADFLLDTTAMLTDLSSFYFDTALSGSPTVLPSLLEFARPGHVLFGSDWPYCPEKTVGVFTDMLQSYQGLDATGHAAINRGSAEMLFPRLARRTAI